MSIGSARGALGVKTGVLVGVWGLPWSKVGVSMEQSEDSHDGNVQSATGRLTSIRQPEGAHQAALRGSSGG